MKEITKQDVLDREADLWKRWQEAEARLWEPLIDAMHESAGKKPVEGN